MDSAKFFMIYKEIKVKKYPVKQAGQLTHFFPDKLQTPLLVDASEEESLNVAALARLHGPVNHAHLDGPHSIVRDVGADDGSALGGAGAEVAGRGEGQVIAFVQNGRKQD